MKTAAISHGQDAAIHQLFEQRPRSRFVRWSLAVLATLAIWAWSDHKLWPEDFLSERRMANLERFLNELRPYPLQIAEADDNLDSLTIASSWSLELFTTKGLEATIATLALSVAAIVLAAAGALVLGPLATRTLAKADPYLVQARSPISGRQRWRRWGWIGLVAGVRLFFVALRSIPEYVLAFLLLSILGPTAWPLLLALAIHNLGILGRLNAEVLENLDPRPLAALRGLGASRRQLAVFAHFPLALPRFLLYFFYRWETCVREATVLGMLGMVSLGYWIVDARARQHYDEMFFFVILGAALVLVGDVVSALARGFARRAG